MAQIDVKDAVASADRYVRQPRCILSLQRG